MYYTLMDSPIDPLLLIGDGTALVGLRMQDQHQPTELREMKKSPALFREAIAQLNAYFAGELREFNLSLAGAGTEFQQQVWQALCTIPFGETVSYQAIASQIHKPKAVRAVGAANGRNPIGILVPCHRVIGANGTLTGYAGGLQRKQWLLQHEQRQASLFS